MSSHIPGAPLSHGAELHNSLPNAGLMITIPQDDCECSQTQGSPTRAAPVTQVVQYLKFYVQPYG